MHVMHTFEEEPVRQVVGTKILFLKIETSIYSLNNKDRYNYLQTIQIRYSVNQFIYN